MRKYLISTFALAVLACGASAASAAEKFGSVAFSPLTQSYGWSNNESSREAAESQAAARCGAADCHVLVWYKNGCGSLAYDGGGYGAGWGANRATSLHRALRAKQSCQQRPDASFQKTVCTSNARSGGPAIGVSAATDYMSCQDYQGRQASEGGAPVVAKY